MHRIFIILFLISIVSANLLIKWIGAYGLWFSSFVLIPFDFITRCIFHEKWSGKRLMINMSLLIITSATITYYCNHDAASIAKASVVAFIAAQIFAGIVYQLNKNRAYFVKVNGSDLFAIIVDSLIFQMVAFGSFDFGIFIGQAAIKFAGGLLWYWLLFKRLKIQDKWL